MAYAISRPRDQSPMRASDHRARPFRVVGGCGLSCRVFLSCRGISGTPPLSQHWPHVSRTRASESPFIERVRNAKANGTAANAERVQFGNDVASVSPPSCGGFRGPHVANWMRTAAFASAPCFRVLACRNLKVHRRHSPLAGV